jgi:hypothetical protein
MTRITGQSLPALAFDLEDFRRIAADYLSHHAGQKSRPKLQDRTD